WLKGAAIVCLLAADLNFDQAADQRADLKASTTPAPAGSYKSQDLPMREVIRLGVRHSRFRLWELNPF
ncbi:hypothetical protein, partial [Novosphingobium aerophilum]|uniref:hypothetical protein n=1 Tax=Novosphingobium aerophilum TaxID=2839843 RepID=UPI001BE49E39